MNNILQHLSASLDLSISDPAFWLPLACYGILFLTILTSMILEGFDIALGFLAPFIGQKRVMKMLSRWREINQFWLLFTIIFFICAFPKAWSYLASMIFYPLILVAIGSITRTLGYEFWLRSVDSKKLYSTLFSIGSICTIFAYGWLLGLFVVNFQDDFNDQLIAFLIALLSFAIYGLLGICWILLKSNRHILQLQAIIWAKRLSRISAIFVILTLTTLVFANTGILNKWIAYARLKNFVIYWFIILFIFVLFEVSIRKCEEKIRQHITQHILYKTPFFILQLLTVVTLPGIAYCYFPFFVYGELSIWESINSIQSLKTLFTLAICTFPVIAIFIIYMYYDMFIQSDQKTEKS
ncbi:cytochrome d ubiquinol oxidase subunit II [Basilea psittacipulmonis]|uniref:Uncharacterized protein n=2 Tax=Basilea TaxID=1472344 RepID=A0A077DFP8_9BURK|nr:cytochrome d ubiquinol oxidase subunit II [Basilea psittacipulmonis]AIL33011.1 hypothetical protein IX83_06510 [Basilea psittacipulmonis DSM 24701]